MITSAKLVPLPVWYRQSNLPFRNANAQPTVARRRKHTAVGSHVKGGRSSTAPVAGLPPAPAALAAWLPGTCSSRVRRKPGDVTHVLARCSRWRTLAWAAALSRGETSAAQRLQPGHEGRAARRPARSGFASFHERHAVGSAACPRGQDHKRIVMLGDGQGKGCVSSGQPSCGSRGRRRCPWQGQACRAAVRPVRGVARPYQGAAFSRRRHASSGGQFRCQFRQFR